MKQMHTIPHKLGHTLAALAVLASCQTDEGTPGGTQGLTATFGVETRAPEGGDAADGTHQLARLFVASRAQEGETDGNSLDLYCPESRRYDLDKTDGGWSYTVDGLTEQWYKFAFVCVPHQLEAAGTDGQQSPAITGSSLFTSEAAGTADFTRLTVDYEPIMKRQQATAATALYSSVSPDTPDLHIYRKVINRSLAAGEDLTETGIEMSRITGLLSFDLGILDDQFEHPITEISLTLSSVPLRVFIADNAVKEDSVEVNTTGTGSFVFRYTVTDEMAASTTDHCRFDIALLPGTVNGTLTLTYSEGSTPEQNAYTFTVSASGSAVSVKPNTRTTVLFNGMTKQQFEVRYAGFDDNEEGTVVQVPGDGWNGWNNNPNELTTNSIR